MARTKSSACSAMRISKTACRKKQDDRLQSGDGRFLYPQYNYTICNHKIFRRYSVVPWPLPSAEGSGSAVPAAAAAGEIGCRWAGWALPPSGGGGAGVHRRGTPCPRRGKRGKGTVWFPCPSYFPNPPLRRDSFGRAAKRGKRGSVPCVGQILGRFQALNLLCVNRRA